MQYSIIFIIFRYFIGSLFNTSITTSSIEEYHRINDNNDISRSQYSYMKHNDANTLSNNTLNVLKGYYHESGMHFLKYYGMSFKLFDYFFDKDIIKIDELMYDKNNRTNRRSLQTTHVNKQQHSHGQLLLKSIPAKRPIITSIDKSNTMQENSTDFYNITDQTNKEYLTSSANFVNQKDDKKIRIHYPKESTTIPFRNKYKVMSYKNYVHRNIAYTVKDNNFATDSSYHTHIAETVPRSFINDSIKYNNRFRFGTTPNER